MLHLHKCQGYSSYAGPSVTIWIFLKRRRPVSIQSWNNVPRMVKKRRAMRKECEHTLGMSACQCGPAIPALKCQVIVCAHQTSSPNGAYDVMSGERCRQINPLPKKRSADPDNGSMLGERLPTLDQHGAVVCPWQWYWAILPLLEVWLNIGFVSHTLAKYRKVGKWGMSVAIKQHTGKNNHNVMTVVNQQ